MGGGELSPPSFQCSTVYGYFAVFMACMLGSLERTFAIDNCPPILATVERDSSPNGYPKDTSHSTSDFTIYVRYMGRLSIISEEANLNYFFLHFVVGLARGMSLLPPLSVCVTSPSSPLQTSYPETSSLKSLYCLKTGSMVSPSFLSCSDSLPPSHLPFESLFLHGSRKDRKDPEKKFIILFLPMQYVPAKSFHPFAVFYFERTKNSLYVACKITVWFIL